MKEKKRHKDIFCLSLIKYTTPQFYALCIN